MAEHEAHKEGEGGGSHGGGGHGGGGHASGGGGHEEHEGAPEWLISFADNVALMMGFFVILLAMNMQKPKAGGIGGEAKMGGAPTPEMLDFIIAMRSEFNPIDINSSNPKEAELRKRILERQAGESRQNEDPGAGREHQSIRPTDFSNLGGNVQFEDDSPSLTETAREQARKIGSRIAGQRYIVEIRGHVSPSEASNNWGKAAALAFSRATAVGDVLAAQGVNRRQMRLATCADNERNTSRSASYDRDRDRQNQRVEVIVTGEVFGSRDSAQELPDRAGESSGDSPAPKSSPDH